MVLIGLSLTCNKLNSRIYTLEESSQYLPINQLLCKPTYCSYKVIGSVPPTLINFTLPTNHECLHCENKLLYTLAHSVLLWQIVISHESYVDSVLDILQIFQS